MATGSLSPVAIQQFFDGNGDPLAGGSLSFYLAGTSTPSPAYADQNLAIALQNPVILDAAGRAPELFLDSLSYKFVLKNALGTTIWTADNIHSAGLLAQLTFQPAITTIAAGGSMSGIVTGSGHNRVLYCSNSDMDLTIGGFAAGQDGDTLLVIANGTKNVLLTHDNSAESVGNRLTNTVRSGATPLVGGYGTAGYQYLAATQHWRLLEHDQGHYITIPWAAGNFLAGSGTWDVPQASQIEVKYLLIGATAEIVVTLGPTTVTSTNQLYIVGWPFHFFGVPTNQSQPSQHVAWTGVDSVGSHARITYVVHDQNPLVILTPDGSPYADGVNYIYGQGRFEIL